MKLNRDSSWSSLLTRSLSAILVIGLISSLFLNDAEAKKRRRRRAPRAKVINEKKLFERMGGREAIVKTVDEWIRLALADATVSERFADLVNQPKELAKTRKLLSDEICELADGPCTTDDSEWVRLRTRFKFDESNAVAFASLLSEALLSRGIGERERNEVLGRLGGIDPSPISEATGPASERRGGTR